MDLNEDQDSSEAREYESEESEEGLQKHRATLIAKPKTKSAVWNFFRVESDSEGRPSNTNKPICCKCNEPVAASYGNTSNLFNHLRRKHPLVYARIHDKKKSKNRGYKGSSSKDIQQTIEQTFSLSQKYDRNGKKWQQLTDKVTRCIAKDMLPISIVEKSGFKLMLESFDPRYQLPSRKHFSKITIPALFNSTQSALVSTLQEVEYFSSTTDLWSSVCMHPYLSYTVHYISKDWKLQSKCLQTMFMPADYNDENLAESLKSVLESWGLQESKQVCVTTDNGSNLVRAAYLLKWLHVPCFGHNLHLAITNAIKDDSRISRAIGITRKLITSFSHSWKKRRELTKIQTDLGIPHHSLIIDCQTRWRSSQKMISRILEQEKALRQVLSMDRKTAHLVPTWQDLEVLESINKALAPLADFTDILSGEKYVTFSALIPPLKHIIDDVLQHDEEDTTLTTDIKQQIITYMQDKYEDTSLKELLHIASLLDPRFKTEYIPNDNIPAIKERISLHCATASSSITTSTTKSAEASPPPAKKKTLGSILKKIEKHNSLKLQKKKSRLN